MSAAYNVMFYASILSSIPYFLHQNAKTKEAGDREHFVQKLDNSLFFEEEIFDYIIVGGGSAGSVLANRLSRDPQNSVLLLDIGGDPDSIQDVPMHTPIQVTPDTDFQYYTVPQENSFHSSGKRWHNIRGKGLGGTGNLNSMVYQRGAAEAYEEWAELTGDRIWAWENVFQFFKKAEGYQGYHQPVDTRYHSTTGEIVVTSPTFRPSSKYFFTACEEMGCNIGDLNTGVHNSPAFDIIEYFINRGKRWGPYQAFLRPVLGRPNLKVYRYARVIKVNIDANMRAKGVTYIRHGTTLTVNVRREIILYAGTFDTPKILMLSGIGPQEQLYELNIPVVKDLPVGENLQDHVGTVVDRLEFSAKGVAYDPARDLSPSSFSEFHIHGTGPLSVPGGRFGTGFYSTSLNPNPQIPDIQYIMSGTYSIGNPMAYPGTPLEQIGEMTEQPDSNIFNVLLVVPYTRGDVKLKSSDPNDDMLIDPKFFSDPRDIPRLIEGINYMLGIYENSTTYKQLGLKLVVTVPEMCKNLEHRSDNFWECYLRFYTGTLWHPVGTCRMGKADDPRSVVDSKLRVIGIDRLRVVDGSVMPKIVNVNTQAPIYMIAEVASHLILQG